MTEKIDCVVIGAGVVGLAVARHMAMSGRETILLEAETLIGSHTSSRNSEVVHAGIYYPKGSLKARFCVAGKTLLYRFCEERGITVNRCGKFIVATSEAQVATLQGIVGKARNNGVNDLQFLRRDEALAREPNLHCVAALNSPSTGVVDSHGFMLGLQGDFEAAGGMLAFGSPIDHARCDTDGITVHTGGADAMALRADVVINSAGLFAPDLARKFAGLPPATVPPTFYCKGNYYSLAGRSPFSRLIYPVPEAAGLGVHLTIDLGGQARFGPDVEWVDHIDYEVDPKRADSFYAAIRSYWPALPDGALMPGYSGIRPKLQGPAAPAGDFVVQGPREHGVKGLVNLYGIESPGLTSSLAIAEYVDQLLVQEAT